MMSLLCLALIYCIIFAFLFGIIALIYDISALTTYSAKGKVIDKWGERDWVNVVDDEGNIVFVRYTYQIAIRLSDGRIVKDTLAPDKWLNIPVGSLVFYSFEKGRLGRHHNVNILPLSKVKK